MSATLILHFFYYKKIIKKYKLSYQKDYVNITKDLEIEKIPDTQFKYGKDKTLMSITLINNLGNAKEYKFYAYYGENNGFIKLDSLCGYSYELIFQNEDKLDIRDSIHEDCIKFDKLDSLNTKNRKRLTLINYNSSNIIINDIEFNLINIISDNCIEKEKSESNQISVKDLKNNIFIVKPILNKNFNNFKYLLDYKEDLNQFSKDLETLLKIDDEKLYKSEVGKLKNKYEHLSDLNSKIDISLNENNAYLERKFKFYKNLLDLDLFLKFYLNEYFMSHKNKIKGNKQLFISFISKLNEIKKSFENKKLELYEKIKIVNTFFLVFEKFYDMESFNSSNIRYFILSEKEDNSIMDKIIKFFNDFNNSISEESLIYPSLLNIDSGYGYHKKDKVYTFDLTTIEMIKMHLKELFPSFIVFYNLKKTNNIAFTSQCGGIAINEYYIFKDIKKKKYDLNYNKVDNDFDENESDEIAIKIALYLIHEYTGHSKFRLSEKGIHNLSPKKFINKNNQVIEFKYWLNYNKNEMFSEFILTSNTDNKGDSGHFIEYSYGKFGKFMIFNCLENRKNVGKLIKRADLFTDDGEILKKYTILKYIAETKEKKFDNLKNCSIEEEIFEMVKVINIEEYKKEMEEKDKKEEEEKDKKEEEEKKSFLKRGKRKRCNETDDKNENKESYKKPKFESNILDNNDESNIIENSENKNEFLNGEEKNEKKEIKNRNEEENEEENEDEDIDEEEGENEDVDEEEHFNNIINKMLKKYNININENIREQIYNLLKNKDLNEADRDNFELFLYRMQIIS